MNQFTLHPNVYSTGRAKGLISLLEQIWVTDFEPGKGTIYIISGFANYNGGVRFYHLLEEHVKKGGKVVAFLGGSTSQRLSSKQVVEELLKCGAEVNIINRKRILHAKLYGTRTEDDKNYLITSSGNFTGPGMSQNVEASILMDRDTTKEMGFSWENLIDGITSQSWDFYQPTLSNLTSPAWGLLYDEFVREVKLDETQEVTLLISLVHADTARIQANYGETAGDGSQYFWLSRDSYDFFPPLTIKNSRGTKATYSCLVKMNYVDLNITDPECRVTFEAENNLDFRLGTGKYRYTKIAAANDLAAITRLKEDEYQIRVFKNGSTEYNALIPYAINFIGHRGKKYGYISNDEFSGLITINIP